MVVVVTGGGGEAAVVAVVEPGTNREATTGTGGSVVEADAASTMSSASSICVVHGVTGTGTGEWTPTCSIAAPACDARRGTTIALVVRAGATDSCDDAPWGLESRRSGTSTVAMHRPNRQTVRHLPAL